MGRVVTGLQSKSVTAHESDNTNINILLDRESYSKVSILELYERSIRMYKRYYQYEQIKGSLRKDVSLIPEEAFREAIANAIVHRTWDVDANITVSMFSDRIEIVSPGGLPAGIDEEEYLKGGISILRNRIIGNVFYRLHLIERFGTGIRRINEEYKKSIKKPIFEVTPNSIRITLPVTEEENGLTDDQRTVYEILQSREASSSVVAEETGFGKSKTVEILNSLVEEGYVNVSGNGRGTRYSGK